MTQLSLDINIKRHTDWSGRADCKIRDKDINHITYDVIC